MTSLNERLPVRVSTLELFFAYFYAYIPMLLGIVAAAAGLKLALEHPGAALPAGPALSLAGGALLFLAGDAAALAGEQATVKA